MANTYQKPPNDKRPQMRHPTGLKGRNATVAEMDRAIEMMRSRAQKAQADYMRGQNEVRGRSLIAAASSRGARDPYDQQPHTLIPSQRYTSGAPQQQMNIGRLLHRLRNFNAQRGNEYRQAALQGNGTQMADAFNQGSQVDMFGQPKTYVTPAGGGSTGFRHKRVNQNYIDPKDLSPYERASLMMQRERTAISDRRTDEYSTAADARARAAAEKDAFSRKKAAADYRLDRAAKASASQRGWRALDEKRRHNVEAENQGATKAAEAEQERMRTDPDFRLDKTVSTWTENDGVDMTGVNDAIQKSWVEMDKANSKGFKSVYLNGVENLYDAAINEGQDPRPYIDHAIPVYQKFDIFSEKALADDGFIASQPAEVINEMLRDAKRLDAAGFPVRPEVLDALSLHAGVKNLRESFSQYGAK